VRTLEGALQPFGQARVRSWGDVVSVELSQHGKTVFSFQIARRSAGLQPPESGPWPGGIHVDSFADLVASKMVALVERGAPRDFRDIYMLCQSGHFDVEGCWDLWTKRQQLADEDSDRKRGMVAIRTHLARLEQARPLEQIDDAGQRTAAEQFRTWFITEFLKDVED
ncbi:MAG: nucleotidyl transferase AbiEii/AbiGii toxin family protein, partial [Chloroflexi bacterium]|nr:nucleotidyl transferase AbiEii/AbiGii toxin family protein [Chloroflexota bacterium]